MVTILVIDDVPAVLVSLRIVLQGCGHKVTGVANGARALELLAAQPFDLVITDIWMPGMTGTELIRQGRMVSPKTRFLAITGGDPNTSGPQDGRRGQDLGADAVLLKPFEKAELVNAVARVIQG